MKKIIRKMKGKKVLSLVLAAIMLATTFNMALPVLKLDASAADDKGGITQERVVGTDGSYVSTYESYAKNFLNGAGKATDIVIPGLNVATDSANTEYQENDFVVQGLSYYPKNDWLMVTAYHNDGTLPSMIFALDAKSGEFKYAFEVVNSDDSENKDHGGGLAFSEYNFYYSGDDTDKDEETSNGDADQIAYAPLSYFDNPTDTDGDGFCEVKLHGAVDLPELNGAATAYVCYDAGILWAGNFFENDTGGADYDVPAMPEDSANGIALHNSMIYGYDLQGTSSEDEWAYLSGAMGNASDCAGAPSHSIAVSTDFEDIQYAVVDNGKVYISRSWGTGKNDEWFATNVIGGLIASLDDYSTLTVGDIDLSVEGTEPIEYQTSDGTYVTTKAHKIGNENTKHFEMMPMSEGLCFVDGELYISFEGASNKYMNEYAWELSGSSLTKTGNCDYPIDVIWHVDPYVLMEEERIETREAHHFEKVTNLSDLKNDDEYIIVYESPEKDPVTQKNILYAFDAYGNLKNYKLTKSTDTNIKGYDGMIGYPISKYSIEDGKLYFTNSEEGNLPNLRWKITDATVTGGLRIQSTLQYFASNRNFYFNDSKISMINDTGIANDPLTLEQAGDTGNFYLKNDNSYLWCNDFSVPEYEALVNNWYIANSSTKMYNGLTETKGTFHTNALSADNIIGKDITPDNYLEQLSIYKCVEDTYSSTAKNRVYTDLSAKLESDGTYTVTLDTYATSALHYKASDVEKPTDFIFVLDESNSMATEDATGMIEYVDADLSCYSVAGDSDSVCDGENPATGTGEIYLNIDGEYINLKVETSAKTDTGKTSGLSKVYSQYVWLFGTYQGQTWYWRPTAPADATQGGGWVTERPSESETIYIEGTSQSNRAEAVIYYGTHYRFATSDYYDTNNQGGRYVTARETACKIIDEVKADAETNGLAHRFAVTQYGGTNGFYPSGTSTINTGTDYSSAFWAINQAETLKSTINAITPSDQTSRASGDEFKYANGIITANNSLYTSVDETGRNVAVIFISDGIAGQETAASGSGCDAVEFSAGGTETEANNIITQAKEVKEKGAFIYTVLVGHGTPGESYDKDKYMKAISSKYPEAAALDDLGGECTEVAEYEINLAISSSKVFVNFVDKLVNDIKTNDSVGVQKLADETIIVEQLSDAFKIPDEYDYDVEFYRGYYDCLDRFQFETEPSTETLDVTQSIIKLNNRPAIQISGFNYSEQYISKGHDGKILRVTIYGLEADSSDGVNITNTSINDTTTTAIYQSSNQTEPFKYFPTEYFTIPKYTYVLDYGLQLLDTDVNGTLKSVSVDLSAQRDADGNISYKDISANGLVKIDDNDLDLLYHTTPTNSTDSGYVLIQRDDGTYDWFEIEVVPASNVYFEEDEMVVKDASSTTKAVWGDVGKSTYTERALPDEDDVDGFDNAYNVQSDYSNGTTRTVTVDSSKRNSQTQTFDFVGTGIDIVSRCGSTTGMMLISVKQQVDDGNGGTKMKTVKASIVDTYCAEGTFNQTPIFSWSGDYGTYTVEIGAMYLTTAGALNAKSFNKSNLIDTGLEMTTSETFDASVLQAMLDEAGVEDVSAEDVDLIWFDDNSIFNGGSGVAPTKKGSRADDTTSTVALENYIDGFRVYNPIDPENADYSVYKATERNVSYANVIENLAPVSSTNGSVIDELYGIAYITGLGEDETTVSFAKYKEAGPKGELYLNGGRAISFKINRSENERVMLGLRAVNGTEATNVSINDGTGESMSVNITSATEMYYDITNCIDSTGEVVITITNNHSTNLLAVNHVKFSGGSGSNGTVVTPRSITRSADSSEVTTNKFLPITQEDLVAIENSMRAEPIPAVVKNGVIVPLVEEDETPDDPTTPNTGDDNVNNDANDDTNTDSDDKEFSIFSLIELLISIIEKILHNAFGTGSMA